MRIESNDTTALLIDVQEKIYPHVTDNEKLMQRLNVLLKGLKVLDIPIITTQQYTKGLGETVEPLKDFVDSSLIIEKIDFSCCDENTFEGKLEDLGNKFVIISGIEAHVCVLQTTIDLVESGYIPFVIEDCISSRHLNDKSVAIERMRHEGVIVSTSESVLFELCKKAGTSTFKEISKLVK